MADREADSSVVIGWNEDYCRISVQKELQTWHRIFSDTIFKKSFYWISVLSVT